MNSSAKWPIPMLQSNDVNELAIRDRLEKEIEKNHKNRMNCSERTLASIYWAFEFDKHTAITDDVIRLASGFGGGGGITSYGMCGAVSGGLMALGLFWGRVDPMDYFHAVGLHTEEAIDKNPDQSTVFYRIFNRFTTQFQEAFGSIVCRELINDYLDADGAFTTDKKLKKEQGVLCKRLTKWACATVMNLVMESRSKGTTHMEMGHNLYNMK